MRTDDLAASPARRGVKVLRLFSRLNVGGPSVHVILLTAGLKDRGYETRLVIGQESPREGNLFDLARRKGVAWMAMPGLGRAVQPWDDLRALVGLFRLMRRYRPDIVHTHTAKAGVLGRLAARAAGVPVVVHTFHGHVLRGYFGALTTAFYRALERRLASPSWATARSGRSWRTSAGGWAWPLACTSTAGGGTWRRSTATSTWS